MIFDCDGFGCLCAVGCVLLFRVRQATVAAIRIQIKVGFANDVF